MAPRKLVPRTRADGTMTEAQYHSHIKGALRKGTRFWKPKLLCLEAAYVGVEKNKSTGRMAKHYECAGCNEHFPAKEVQVDHIEPVMNPEHGFRSWDEVIERMYCDSTNMQVLCKTCHAAKTLEERQLAKQIKGMINE